MRGGLKIFIVILAFFAGGVSFAQAPSDAVVVNLTHHKVSVSSDGKEQLLSGAAAKPGELIEYRATYVQHGKAPVKNVIGTLPVPAGMEYVAGSAHPAKVLATLDDIHYEPIPLMRKVKAADGKEILQAVPVKEYRALRWQIGALQVGESVTVSARARVQ